MVQFRMEIKKRNRSRIHYIWGIFIFLIVWQIASLFHEDFLLPDVKTVISGLLERLFQDIHLWRDILSSAIKVVLGFFTAATLGLILGIFMHQNAIIKNIFSPILSMSASAPPISWIVLAIVWFGIGILPPVLVIIATIVPMIAMSSLNAVRHIDERFGDVLTNYRIPLLKKIFFIYLPGIFSLIFCSLKISLGLSWRLAATAEFFSSDSGLGYSMSWAHANMDMERIIAITLILVAAGMVSEWILLTPLEKKINAWKN